MAPKKKSGATTAPTTSKQPSQASAGGAAGAGTTAGPAGAGGTGGAGVQHPHRSGDRSQHTGDGADGQLQRRSGEHNERSNIVRTGASQDPATATYKDGVAMSNNIAAGRVLRPSQDGRATLPRSAHGPGRHQAGPEHHPHDVQAPLPPCQPVGEHALQQQVRDELPAGPARSRTMSRSVSPAMPTTAAEAMARVQLLLNFLPAPHKMEEWRATIQSLISFADPGKTQEVGPSRRPPTVPAGLTGCRAREGAPTV
jgi:hypothetical protein